MKKEILVDLFVNAVIALIGLWIFINPGIGIDFVRLYLGVILVIGGIGILLLYYFSKEREFKRVLQGAILIIIGGMLVLSRNFTTRFIGIALIIWMVAEGIYGLNQSVVYKKFNINAWKYMLIYTLIAFALAIFIFFNIGKGTFIFISLSGLFALIRGIFGIIDALLYRKIYKVEVEVVDEKVEDPKKNNE